MTATILFLPDWHRARARARFLVRFLVTDVRDNPRPPRPWPGGMFAPLQEDDAA